MSELITSEAEKVLQKLQQAQSIVFTHAYFGAHDRKGWTGGEWDYEPDKAQWVDAVTDLDCLIVRNSFGNLCGYVGVPSSHPFHDNGGNTDELSCHGGVTFTGFCQEQNNTPEGRRICHRREDGRPEVFWIGFDCAHADDYVPKYGKMESVERYKNLQYVVAECTHLAFQLGKFKPESDAHTLERRIYDSIRERKA